MTRFPEIPTIPLRVERQSFLDKAECQRIHDLSRRILAEIGLEVRSEDQRRRLEAGGLGVRGERVLFPVAMVDAFVEEAVSRNRTANQGPAAFAKATTEEAVLMEASQAAAQEEVPGPVNAQAAPEQIRLWVSTYALYVHDLETGGLEPYTSERLVEMCKLVDSLAEEGVSGSVPGIPLDVAPSMQSLAQYRLAALYSRQGGRPVDPTSAQTIHYLLDMAEVMEQPVRSLPVYVPSPLRFGGESLEIALACAQRLEQITVGSMPATGTSAPIQPFGALVQNAAEAIGGAIAVQILSGKPTSFTLDIFPADLRAGSMVFGSPENMLYQMLAADLKAYYHLGKAGAGPGNIHVMAKLPGSQAAAEKMAIMMLGAALGVRDFGSAGTLSLDEVFSPEQLLVDCEMRDQVQRAVQGVWLGEETAEDWLEEMRRGVERGFLRSDSTLDHYRTATWYPQRFERKSVGAWMREGQVGLGEKLRGEVRRRISGHAYELEAGKRQEIERIYAAAERKFGRG
jgi:trimethylamine:corrinoid methyltransferase-like protein